MGNFTAPLVRRAMTVALLCTAIVALGAAPATAAPAWTTATTPNPAGAPDGSLAAVTCRTATDCTAVGSYVTSASLTKPLAQRWNGTTWTPTPTPSPSGSAETSLKAIACPGATSCFAVGAYASGDTGAPLIQRWNGTAWSTMASPVPAGSVGGELDGISCPGLNVCVAVGSYVSSTFVTRSLVQRWNGTSWLTVGTLNPTGALESHLRGVACVTTTNCLLVGEYANAVGPLTLVGRWTGTALTQVTSPTPAGTFDVDLAGIACTSATSCLSAGWVDVGLGRTSLVQRWNGTTWTTLATPKPTGSVQWELSSIACPAAATCIAVGDTTGSSGKTVTLSEKWNGTTWTVVNPANRTGAPVDELSGVACTATTSCMAVGSADGTLAESWNGTAWSLSPAPVGSSQAGLERVACVTAAFCMSVGSAATPAGPVALTQQWNGTAWATVATPAPVGGAHTSLTDVACTATNNCVAVGSYEVNSAETPLAMRWNGTAWSILTTPVPANTFAANLTGLTCVTVSNCIAVGSTTTFDGETSLIEKWNGTAWTIMTSPTPTGSTGVDLSEVSCASATSCWAIGLFMNSAGYERPLGLRWNGTAWSQGSLPVLTGTVDASLQGVSCFSTTQCLAVGSSSIGLGQQTLAERWNGTAWSIVTSPNPVGAFTSDLRSVSCTSLTSCVAVGLGFDGSRARSIIESWNGTAWSLMTAADPGTATDSGLNGVTCVSNVSCVAVGSWDINASRRTLTERYA